MNIGIDIDNVISNFDEALFDEFLAQNKGYKMNYDNSYIDKGMFSFPNQKEFYLNNIERIAKNLGIISGADKYIKRLKDDGHCILIISARQSSEYKEPYKLTTDWLKNKNIVYDKLILTNAYDNNDKANKCIENKVDIMIDDQPKYLRQVKEKGIHSLLMNTSFNQDAKDLLRVNNWREIYLKCCQINDELKQRNNE